MPAVPPAATPARVWIAFHELYDNDHHYRPVDPEITSQKEILGVFSTRKRAVAHLRLHLKDLFGVDSEDEDDPIMEKLKVMREKEWEGEGWVTNEDEYVATRYFVKSFPLDDD